MEKPLDSESTSSEPTSTAGAGGGFTLSRRQFLLGAGAATLVVVGSVGIMSGCSAGGDGDGVVEAEELEVDESQVVVSSDFAERVLGDCASLSAEFDIPMGSVGHMDDSNIAVFLSPGDSTDVLAKMSLLSVSAATLTTVLDRAVGAGEGYQIYDARCNDRVALWVECNLYTDDWRVYMAPVESSASIGEAVLVDEGDADYDPPMLCVCGGKAFWTLMPFEEGSISDTDSYLKCASLAGGSPQVVYTSHGRMVTNPLATDGIVTIVPRADSSSTRYQMTAIDADSLEVVAAQVLPGSMRANFAIYMGGSFVFGIEQTYSYGDGISSFGTYAPMGDGRYLRYNRTPAQAPAMVGKYLVVKSTSVVVGVDMAEQAYFPISKVDGAESYGDFLLSTGTSERIVVYSSVPAGDGSGDGNVHVRAFSVL